MKKKIPIRKCIGCGQRKSKFELIRIVNNQDQIVIDPSGKLPGRGAYICPDKDCLEKARKKNSLDAALKTKVSGDVYRRLLEEIDMK